MIGRDSISDLATRLFGGGADYMIGVRVGRYYSRRWIEGPRLHRWRRMAGNTRYYLDAPMLFGIRLGIFIEVNEGE